MAESLLISSGAIKSEKKATLVSVRGICRSEILNVEALIALKYGNLPL